MTYAVVNTSTYYPQGKYSIEKTNPSKKLQHEIYIYVYIIQRRKKEKKQVHAGKQER